ncbi:5-hydroxytryptamine receptor 3A-like isoform X1 [Coturnix japonica]|uniref:5-hydroxytryptamine receptor 3A-like isoform X1 n=2 Tax=Coturnix japonica TaxID=93934 RepID=UPI0013A5CDF1|nr:5-hydroxytryptamine receptor 3A-like isoform X1 [Coturnix japonica]
MDGAPEDPQAIVSKVGEPHKERWRRSGKPRAEKLGKSIWGWSCSGLFTAWRNGAPAPRGAAPRYICTYYDVIEYLNISSHSKLHTQILPKTHWKEPMEVMMDFMLIAILSVAEKLQTVTFYFVLSLEWTNTFATWDPRDFCNISKIVLPMDSFWSPPIFILERVNEQKSNLEYIAVTHNGTFNASLPFQVTLTCGLMILKFPFDTQTCNISIASFLYPATDLSMKVKRTPAEMLVNSQSFFLTDGEWKFTNLSINEYMEEIDDGEFPVITYMISMKRRPTLYILNLILPTCALYLLDMAVLFGPSSLEEKVSFQISIILGSSMLAVILNNMLPTSSNEPPIIVLFFLGTFLLMIMAVLDTFFLLHHQHKSLRLGKAFRTVQQGVHPEPAMTTNPGTKHPTEKSQEKLQQTRPCWETPEQDPVLVVLEKVLLYSHFFLSLFFFAVISVKWSS